MFCRKVCFFLLVLFACLSVSFADAEEPRSVDWFNWTRSTPLPESMGNVGTFAGLTEEGIVVAGGVSLSTSEEEAGKNLPKHLRDTVCLLEASGKDQFR